MPLIIATVSQCLLCNEQTACHRVQRKHWAAWYHTWLLTTSTLKGVAFALLFFSTKDAARSCHLWVQFREVSEEALQRNNWALMRQLWFTDEPQVHKLRIDVGSADLETQVNSATATASDKSSAVTNA